MISKELSVVNPSGLHLGAAAILSKEAMKFKCDINIKADNKTIAVKSVLNVMAAGLRKGTPIILECDGEDEAKAIEKLSEVITEGIKNL